MPLVDMDTAPAFDVATAAVYSAEVEGLWYVSTLALYDTSSNHTFSACPSVL